MTQKLKKILCLTLFIGLLLLQSCQKDPINSRDSESNYFITNKTVDDLFKDPNFTRAYNKMPKLKNNPVNQLGRTVMEEQYGFTIANNLAKVITKDSIISYTLGITRSNNSSLTNDIENLVIQNNTLNNTVQAIIIKYKSNTPILDLESFSGQKELTPIVFNSNSVSSSSSSRATIICFEVISVEGCSNPNTDTHTAGGGGCWGGSSNSETICTTTGNQDGTGGNSTNPYGNSGGNTTQTTGGAGGSAIHTSPVNPINLTSAQNFISDLNAQQTIWWTNPANQAAVRKIEYYLNSNNYSPQSVQFANWAINYLAQNTNVTWQQFQNWFMGSSEGTDGDYDDTFWNNPSLTFPSQNLPTFNNFFLAYPSHLDTLFDTSEKMYSAIGGDVKIKFDNGARNTCALRISRALNYSGIAIPNIRNITVKGADGKYYFLVAANLLSWMKKTFGTPTGSNYIIGSQGGLNGVNFPSLVSGKKGIYIMIPNIPGGCPTSQNPISTGFCASGHADILENQQCDSGGSSCYFAATGGVKEIFIWELP